MHRIEKWQGWLFVIILFATYYAINARFNPYMLTSGEFLFRHAIKWNGEILVESDNVWYWPEIYIQTNQSFIYEPTGARFQQLMIRDANQPDICVTQNYREDTLLLKFKSITRPQWKVVGKEPGRPVVIKYLLSTNTRD